VGDNGLVKTRQALADGVRRVLHQAPHVPRAVFEIHPNHTANTVAVVVAGFGDEVVDAPWIKDSVCIHANNLVKFVDTTVVKDE
jgi:hypothetical protein